MDQVLHVFGEKRNGIKMQVSVVHSDMLDAYLVKVVKGTGSTMLPVASQVVDTYADAVAQFQEYKQVIKGNLSWK